MSPDTIPQAEKRPPPPTVMIVAGEASGDLHGSNLVRAMGDLDPTIRFFGIGGTRMREAGVRLLADAANMAVVGLTEVFAKLGVILKARRDLRAAIKATPPDLVILIDYPDFNLPLAKMAKKLDIPVFYYISPQVWAWRSSRIGQIRKVVDRMAVILPFEASLYRDAGVDVTFVGHPLLEVVKTRYTRPEALERFGLAPEGMTVALLPGSREGEVLRLLPEMLGAARQLLERDPTLQFVLPVADSLDPDFIDGMVRRFDVPVRMIPHDTYDALAVSDAAIVASGTATLETALLSVPMVVVYRVSAPSYAVGRLVIHIDCIGLVNIVAGERIVPELVQGDATADRMAEAVWAILSDRGYRESIRAKLAGVRERLGTPGAAGRAARLAYGMIGMKG